MLNKLFRMLLYISSYSPLLLLIFINNLPDFTWTSIKQVLLENKWFWVISFVIITLANIALFLWLRSMKREANSKGRKSSPNNLTTIDNEILSYFVTYIVPLLSLNIKSGPSILMNVLLIILLGIYFVNNNALHFNIMLIIFGYHIYTNNQNHIFISKKELYEINDELLEADQIGTSQIFYI